ncbi:short chain dehydrogenase [Thermodesulfobacteriota bacterium]
MRVLLIGATGTIGKRVAELLDPDHELVKVAHRNADLTVDLGSKDSIEALFREVGSFDALVCTAGVAKLGTLDELTDEDYMLAINNKLMGQVNLVRLGREHINDQGSFTLTSGMFSYNPTPQSTALSMVNSGLEGFVRAAALQMVRGVRINVVSPVWVKETMEAIGMDSSGGMPAIDVARAYKEGVEGRRNGEVLHVKDFV